MHRWNDDDHKRSYSRYVVISIQCLATPKAQESQTIMTWSPTVDSSEKGRHAQKGGGQTQSAIFCMQHSWNCTLSKLPYNNVTFTVIHNNKRMKVSCWEMTPCLHYIRAWPIKKSDPADLGTDEVPWHNQYSSRLEPRPTPLIAIQDLIAIPFIIHARFVGIAKKNGLASFSWSFLTRAKGNKYL